MLAVQGYYDGVAVKPLEEINAKPNQRVIITIMDEFVEPAETPHKKGMRGVLSLYADPSLREKEKCAWQRTAVENSPAFNRLMELCRPIPDLHEKKELVSWREEKFGHAGIS